MMNKNVKPIPIIIGGAVVLGGVGASLLARRRFQVKTSPLGEADLTSAEWQGAVEFEEAGPAPSA